jgi:CHAT domain-containing protein
VDESAWERYRARVRADIAASPVGRKVEQRRVIEELLGRAAELDRQVTQVARSLSPDDLRAFLDVLTLMRAAEFGAVSGGGSETPQEWYARIGRELEAGEVPLERQPHIDRIASVFGLPVKVTVARQFAPAAPAAAQPAAGPEPAVYEAAQPLIARYSAAQPRVLAGAADESLVDALTALLTDFQDMRDRQPAGSGNWKFLHEWCAMVTGSLARSAAILRHAGLAVERFGQAAGEWRRIGETARADDCLTRAAEIAQAAGADVDKALEPLLERVGPPEQETGTRARPTIARARLLARLAQIYFDAGDHFDARVRVEESARALVDLGFADPGAGGVPAAFADWVAADPGEDMGTVPDNRTHAMLSAVAETWAKIALVRMGLAPGDGAQPADLVHQLGELARRLGTEARQIADRHRQEAARLGILTAQDAPGWAAAGPAREEAAAKYGWLSEQQLELSRLQDAYSRSEDPGEQAALLARTEALEDRLLAGNVAGAAPTAVTAGVLRSDLLVQLGRGHEAADVLDTVKRRLAGDPGQPGDPGAPGRAGLADAERRSLLVTVIGRAVVVAGSQGDFGRMSELCGEGIAEAELDRGKVNGPYLQDGYLRNLRYLYDGGVFAAHRTGDHELMLARSELAKARGVLGWAVTGHGQTGDSQEDEQAFHELTAALAGRDGPALADGDRARLAATRRVLWDRLMTRRSRSGVQGSRPSRSPAFSLAAVQATLAPDEAVITYHWLGRGALLAVTIDAGSLVAEKITMDEARRADLDSIAADIGAITLDAPWLERESRKLGRLLLPRQGRELLAGKQRLIVSPHRLLHQLPFHTFGFDGAPLAERFAVSYVPNLTSLLLPAAGAAGEVLALGVSAFGPGMAPLANAGPEAAAVAGLYRRAAVPVTLATDGQATVGWVNDLREQGALGRFGTLHLATHGDDVPVSAPFDAGLYLRDGKIDGLEISQWRLRADLVVLSACHSARRAITGRKVDAAGDEELFGDEVLGLQAAFFAAGARQVLGALWPVSDRSGQALMCAFHRHLIAGRPAEAALRQAMLDVRDTNPSMFHWAPYKLVRLGRARTETAAEPEGSGHDRD